MTIVVLVGAEATTFILVPAEIAALKDWSPLYDPETGIEPKFVPAVRTQFPAPVASRTMLQVPGPEIVTVPLGIMPEFDLTETGTTNC